MTMSTFFSVELDEHRGLLLRGLEAAEHRADAHREIGEPLAEGAEVLVGENRRRHEHRDLPPGLHRLERGAHGDLRLAVADVADEQAIHRPRALHVALHLVVARALVGRVLEEEADSSWRCHGVSGTCGGRDAILRRA